MATNQNPKNEPTIYQIRVRGHLKTDWGEWFGEATITLTDNGDTVLTCSVIDQAALYGLLKRVRDLAMPLISLKCVQPDDNSDIGEIS